MALVVTLMVFAPVMATGGGVDEKTGSRPERPRTIPDAAEASLHNALHQLRYMTGGDPAKTTSQCIGNPVTPLCAAETYMANSHYEGNSLLHIAQGRVPGGPDFELPEPWSTYTDCYQLVGYWYYQTDDIVTVNTTWDIEAGDVAMRFYYGRVEDGACNLAFFPSPFPNNMLLRRGEYGWRVLARHPREEYIRIPYSYLGR